MLTCNSPTNFPILLLCRLIKYSFGWLLAVVFFLGNFAVWFMPLYEAHTYGVLTLTLDKYSKYQKWKTGWILAGWAVFLVFGMSLSAAKWDTWLTVLLEIVYL